MLALNACDFGDLLMHMLTVFKRHRDVLEMYQQRFKYIMVDEYQDTNSVQYLWLRLLAMAHTTSAWWATMTSRSIHGAAPKSPTS
jgi:DNA helicase-2/ATP-dependent DNA helicase PcrA